MWYSFKVARLWPSCKLIHASWFSSLYINIYMQILYVGPPTTFFFAKLFVFHLQLIYCANFIMHSFTSTGLTAADGLCCPLLPTGKCILSIIKIVSVSDQLINLLCVCCVGICYVPLPMVFIEVWGSLDSEECILWFWLLSLHYCHHCY